MHQFNAYKNNNKMLIGGCVVEVVPFVVKSLC